VVDSVKERPRTKRITLETMEPTSFGYGFISGLIGAILGITSFGIIVSLRFPHYFAYAELRPLHSFEYIRAVIHVMLVASFLLGSVSAVLRANKTLALVGIGFTLIAALLGGAQVRIGDEGGQTAWLGVDFFVLNLVLYSAVFVPLERLFALRADQPVFRRQWMLDLTYFFVNSLLIEVLTILTLGPALILFEWARVDAVRNVVGSWPLVVQVPALVIVADFTQYWVHRTFHVVGFLWPFHAIHHSIEHMDWLAGSRLHLVDVAVTRGLTYVPIYVLGFSQAPLVAYVAFVSAQATFIHANVRFRFGALGWLLATPRFHHWHHGAEAEAIDKNFAVHLPVIDWLFGTFYLPTDRWPASYGLADGTRVPEGFVRQFVEPFRRTRDDGPRTIP
jgi:sterol desaturase/sphingolipid hydroxylase (fatty acid hydroxylase superfamily)